MHRFAFDIDTGHSFSPSNIDGHQTVTLMVKFTPTLSGLQKLLASLDCQELTQVYGVADILVREK